MAARATRRSSGPVIRSISPSARFNGHNSTHSPSSHSSSSFASATASAFTTARSFRRPASPTRVNLYNCTSQSLSFSLDRPGSPNRSISFSRRSEKPQAPAGPPKKTCMCSPTNHPGSFRCSLHKGLNNKVSNAQTVSCGSSSRLNMRRSAMKNSLVRIGTVEGDLVKRALAALIRPSSHQQRRRGEFRPRPSRLSVMSKA
ncbi:hypothetical protein CDL12_06997 [Handroanthus impetiginosus]|uniref:Serine-rich protein-like protein n=1 Tax=Handroanthus impetiginosus TaxID=429701 RepID=A0A2G9HS18_9LAMI|nr:hypothetical protein CDL12_06997 [Handroanthus impetiginosus]